MESRNQETRKIAIPPDTAYEIIRGSCHRYGIEVKDIESSEFPPDGHRITILCDHHGFHLAGPSPCIKLEVELVGDSRGNTVVRFEKSVTRAFRNSWGPWLWVSLGALLLGGTLLVLVENILFMLFMLIAPLALAVYEATMGPAKRALPPIEAAMWQSLEATGSKVVAVSAPVAEMHDEVANSVTAALGFFVIPVALFWVFGFHKVAFAGLLVLCAPLLLCAVMCKLLMRLPLRYWWQSYRASLSVSWAFFMLALPFPSVFAVEKMEMTQGALSWLKFGVDELPKLLDGGVGFVFFVPFMLLVGFLGMVEDQVKKSHEENKRFMESGTAIYDELKPPTLHVQFYGSVVAIFFLLLSGLVVWALVELLQRACSPEWRHRLLAYHFREVEEMYGPIVGKEAASSVLAHIAALVIPLGSICPLILSIASYVVRLSFYVRRPGPGSVAADAGADFLSALTRPGLFDEIKEELGANWLVVRRNSDPFVPPFGASIIGVGVFRRSYVLVIDPLVVAIVKDARQREAVIWHEIGHVKRRSRLRSFVADLVFNIWSEHLKSMVADQLMSEIEADRFAAKRMGSSLALSKALEVLNIAGWGTAPIEKERLRSRVKSFTKLLLGFEGLGYLHPHFALRIEALATCLGIPARGPCPRQTE